MNIRKACQRLFLAFVGTLCMTSVMAQTITVSGVVRDSDDDSALPGVAVQVEGTQQGTVTDFDGRFTLNVPEGSQLIFSFLGYETQTVGASSSMDVTMISDMQALADVVVIGYGVAKKNDMTGSVVAIKPDEMSKGITSNATDMLVGKVAGVDVITSGGTPGAGAQIRIRGGSSLNASNDPLLVIDGLTIDNNTATGMSNVLAMINPNDIESFTVLKDASATAIYGSRASNGVIIITTKKGGKNQSPHVSYNGDVTVSTTQKRYDVLSGDEYRDLVADVMGDEGVARLGDADTDWQDEIFRVAWSTSHNLSLTGGWGNTPYRLSVGYQGDEGIIKKSWMHRFNCSLNVAPSFLNDHLNFNITAKFTAEKDRYVDAGSVIGAALSMDPTQPVTSDEDRYQWFDGYWQNALSANYSDPEWAWAVNPNAPQNPVAYLNQVQILANAYDFTGNFEVDYKIHRFEDMHIHASYGGQYTKSNQDDISDQKSYNCNYYGWEGVTKYYKYSITTNAYLQYQKTAGINYIDIMLGGEESHYHRDGWSSGCGTDPYTGEINSPSLREETAWATHNSLVSYFGRLNYTILDRYMLTATFRADGSSRFAKGHKWGYFPSVALAWKISEENFLKSSDVWDDFKLRLGWGQTGQQDIGDDFLYAPLYVQSNSYAQYPFGEDYYTTMRPNKYNPDLTWETTTTYNVGLDFSFMRGRYTANIDGYYRETKDLIQDVTLPVLTNFGQRMSQNIGSLKNYGVEFAFGIKPFVKDNFVWDIQYNISWNHNEITELIGGDDSYLVKTGTTISRGNATQVQAHTVGQPASSFYVYQQVYDENGKPIEGVYVDRDGNGILNDDDRYFYKSPAAPVIMGLTLKFIIYKHFDLSGSFRASIGNYVYYDFLSDKAAVSASGLYSNSAYLNTTKEDVDLGFTGTNGTEYYLSDYFVKNASFLKCSNITLGYSFDSIFKKNDKNFLPGRIYVTAQNPFTVTKYKGLDPEVADGIDKNPYPRPFSVQLGLNLNF